MFTLKDIEARSIFVINCIDHERRIRVKSGEMLLEEHVNENKDKTLTKCPFQKILMLMVIGHISITSPLIEKCRRYGVALVVLKPNLRPVFWWSDSAEGNFLLRRRQYSITKNDIRVATVLIADKIRNQRSALKKTRCKDKLTTDAIDLCSTALNTLPDISDHNTLMGLEGTVAKSFFAAYFQKHNWYGRHPRTKCDVLNATLDIGYTMLFNFVESFLRFFGFDLYVGVFHCLWFKRKSLVCDMVEPFRCIIDHATLLAYNRKQFTVDDFTLCKHEYYLKHECAINYYRVYMDALIARKNDIFKFIQQYYRAFMGDKPQSSYPKFEF